MATRRPKIIDKDKGWKATKIALNPADRHVAVGIFGVEAIKDHGGLPNIKVATAHEFGARISHPGGTAFIPEENGRARFISNATAAGHNYPRTRPHTIEIPRRSFIRDTVAKRKNSNQIMVVSRNLAKMVLERKMSHAKALLAIGVLVQGMIRARISKGIPPPLAPATITRKGSSKPLIDTGQLRGSIDFELRGGKR